MSISGSVCLFLMKFKVLLYCLRLLVLVCIFGFSSINFLQQDSAKTTLNDIKTITIASQNYFNDIGYWPISIKDLINKNYLKGVFDAYSLLNQNGELNVVIEATDENNTDLGRYFIKHRFDKDTNKILIQIEEYRKVKAGAYVGVCSNLYCPLY